MSFDAAAAENLLKVFGISFVLLLTKVLAKYTVKGSYISASSTATAADRAAVHFDCLRVGVDLALLGLVSYLTVLEIATTYKKPVAFGTVQKSAIIVQVLCFIAAIFFTQRFDSATKTFRSGIFVPLFCGWVSVWLSMWAYVAALG